MSTSKHAFTSRFDSKSYKLTLLHKKMSRSDSFFCICAILYYKFFRISTNSARTRCNISVAR